MSDQSKPKQPTHPDDPPFDRWRPHPWHGLAVGLEPPKLVHAYIEITPFDLIKYEVDKLTGYMRVNRLQRSSSLPPALYGFVPRTCCGPRVQNLCPDSTEGDGDPLDICVICERPITRAEVLLNARVVGGFQTIDRGQADDKIIAVLNEDDFWADAKTLADIPSGMVTRLRHYFSTYKMLPGEANQVTITAEYGPETAYKVVKAAMADYQEQFDTAAD